MVAADSRTTPPPCSAAARGPVITDVKLPDGDGIEILRHVKSAPRTPAVIVMTAFGSTETAVAAMKLGAHDYLIKPFDVDELKIVVRNALERQQLQRGEPAAQGRVPRPHGLDRIDRRVPVMVAVFELVRSVAATSSTVLITGESGTGKELVAKAIHALSPPPRRRPSCPSTARPARDPAGERAVRPREGRLHRRAPEQEGPLRGGAPGHAVPRRGGGDAAFHAGQAAARPPGEAGPAGGRHRGDRWTCA